MIDQNFQRIMDTLMDLGAGKFDTLIETTTSPQSDETEAILTGLQMLGEELESTTISRNYFNNIFHSVSDMIFVLNLDGTIKSINNSVKQLLPCSEDELMNTSIEKLFPISKNKLFKEIATQLQNDCKIVSETIQLQCKNASIETQCTFTPLHSKENENIGFLLIARDVQKLKEYETKYQKIFQDSSDVIFIMDKDYQIFEINKSGKQLLNLKNGLPTIFDLFAEATGKIDFERVLKKNKSIIDFYAKLKAKQGKQTDCLISVNKIEGNSGSLQGIIKDISVQKENENIILNTIVQTEENERKRIAADLHDSLGQQLSTILFYLSTIKGNKYLSTGNTAEILEKAHVAISNSVQELRDICFNVMPRTLEDYGLIEAIKELSFKIEKKDILKFDISFPKTKNVLSKNLEVTLFRVIQEFINNTIKHANAEEVKIKCTFKKGCLNLDISDNGIGFELQEQLSTKGMGIKNMKSRLLPYNGKIKFTSKLNQGTHCKINIDKHYLNKTKS